MLKQPTTPAARHSESEWWIRLASFASETQPGVARRNRVKRMISVLVGTPKKKRGFRLNLWRPLFLLMLGSGPQNQRRLRGQDAGAVQGQD
ncbi:MAG: hypothetical protein H7Z16_01480 [Pyrinomonadaceae bacterium]|nr:hypothetical protein [Pyrinomonadaceae bacterium]